MDAGAVWIEDRIQIKSVAIDNGQIQLEIITEGPGDAACCKSHKAPKTYALQAGQLAEIPAAEVMLEKISAADLNGTEWMLAEISAGQPVLTDTVVTLNFADVQLSGSGGCNSYNGGFTLDEINPFVMTIGPVASTKMACPEPMMGQEMAYLTALQGVSQWGYLLGNLAMYYPDGQDGLARLLFTPAPVAEAEASQLDMLPASSWQWVSFTDPMQQFAVRTPENYTLTFQPAGTLVIKADCNNASASYSATEEGRSPFSRASPPWSPAPRHRAARNLCRNSVLRRATSFRTATCLSI